MAVGDPLTDLSDVIANATATSAEQINFFKQATIGAASPGTAVANALASLWRYDGQPGSGATAPTTAAVPTNTTNGALRQSLPATSARKRLLSVMVAATQIGMVVLYDRVSHQGGLSGTATSAQTTNLPTAALTRHTSGVGVEAWLEIYTQVGATAKTATCSYTDDSGNTGNASTAVSFGAAGFQEQDRVLAMPLASGDKGVKAVASVTLSGSTGTAGAFGVTLAYPLVTIPFAFMNAGYVWNSVQTVGGPLDLGVNSDACLAWLWYPMQATWTTIFGMVNFLEK